MAYQLPPFSNPLSALVNNKPVRVLARKRRLLLHQQHGQAVLFDELADDFADLGDNFGLDTFAGFIQDQHSGFDDQYAADGELWLLAAGEIAAKAVSD
jgi:hypothetical protein